MEDVSGYDFGDEHEALESLIEYCEGWGFSSYNNYEEHDYRDSDDSEYYSDWEFSTEWFVDNNPANWGYEILGWEDEQKTIPRLGQLKNFDPLYK
jgi:hypothetical protein